MLSAINCQRIRFRKFEQKSVETLISQKALGCNLKTGKPFPPAPPLTKMGHHQHHYLLNKRSKRINKCKERQCLRLSLRERCNLGCCHLYCCRTVSRKNNLTIEGADLRKL